MKRISFNEHDAAHLFEWGLSVRQIDPVLFDGCFACENLIKRLGKFLGDKKAKELRRLLAKYPYVRK